MGKMGKKVASPDFTEEEKKEVVKKLREQGPVKTAEDAHEIAVQLKDRMAQIIKYVESSAYYIALVNIAKLSCRLTLSVDGKEIMNCGFEPAAEDGDGDGE